MSIRVALAQTQSEVGTEEVDPREANLKIALSSIQQAADEEAELVVLGELHLSGYRTDEHLYKYATVIDPPDMHVQALADAAAKHGVHIIIGAATVGGRFPGDIYNSALLIGPAGLLGVYRKAHVGAFAYEDGISKEICFYGPGKDLPVFDTPIGRIGIHICYDICFPEVARVQTIRGADILINVAASAAGFEELWAHYLFARAAENACWYVVCSVVGKQRGDVMFGHSRIINPKGKLVAEAKQHQEDFVVFDIDYEMNREVRAQSHLLNHRNPSLYSAIVDESPYP